jgi:hypothetical protein
MSGPSRVQVAAVCQATEMLMVCMLSLLVCSCACCHRLTSEADITHTCFLFAYMAWLNRAPTFRSQSAQGASHRHVFT